jgi:hypothetical protein
MKSKSKKQMVGSESFKFVGYVIDLRAETEGGELFVCGTCPLCGQTEESSDHGHGQAHASAITQGKIKAHMKLSHKITEDANQPKSNTEPCAAPTAGRSARPAVGEPDR